MNRLTLAVFCIFLLFSISCHGGEGRTLPELFAAVESLRKEVERVRTALGEELQPSAESTQGSFTLQLLHASDMDGATGALQHVKNFSAILNTLRSQYPENTLVLSSGDNWIPGPRYYAAAEVSKDSVLGIVGFGRGDIALLNAIGFQASALGNHELDRGTAEFASIIGAEADGDNAYPGAAFPYLSSNLVFADDEHLAGLVVPDGQEAMLVGASLARSAVISLGGERVGIVGATTPSLASITSTGDISIEPAKYSLDSLADIIQASVDALIAQGVNKVILLSHMQRIDIEQALAERLSGVDIIVAGGSNTLLADHTDRLWPGDVAADTYPLAYESASGEPVLLVNTDADYKYLGRLVVEFDQAGRVVLDSIDPYISGAYATNRQGGQLFAGKSIPEVLAIAASLRQVLQEQDGNILARTDAYLEGRRSLVRAQETNLGNLTADANLWMARLFDPETGGSIKNEGGIRDSIGRVVQPPGSTSSDQVEFLPPSANPVTGKLTGEISQLDIEGALRFNNGLVIVPVTARQLVNILEHAVAFEGVGEVPVGNFPQVSGIRLSFDPSGPSGQRIRSLALVDERGVVTDRVVVDGALTGDAGREIKVATLDFLAYGGGGFPFPLAHADRVDLAGEAGQFNALDPDFPDTNGNGKVDDPKASDPGLSDFAASGTEQDALAEYLAHFYSDRPYDHAETGPMEDWRIQNLGINGKPDTVFVPGSEN